MAIMSVNRLVEATGGVCPHACAHGRRLAERARAKGGTDRTEYGRSRGSTRSFYVHHMQQISKAAVRRARRARDPRANRLP